jgi:two-component system chemotaxis response regulator CheB
MVSSLTSNGAEVTLQALALGAVDFIAKPDGTVSLHIGEIRATLVAKVRGAAKARLRQSRGLLDRVRHGNRTAAHQSPAPDRPASAQRMSDAPRAAAVPVVGSVRGVVLVGVSTGGPGAIETIIPRLPRDFPWPVLIAQHMPESFTGVFARRIDGLSELEVVEVARPMPLRGGAAYIGRGDADLVIANRGGVLTAVPMPASSRHNWHPSVERLVTSALEHVEARRLLGVMLTGMGDDGAAAMAELRARGGRTIAESEETAVVWGMPGELVKRGGASLVLPLQLVAEQLRRWAI